LVIPHIAFAWRGRRYIFIFASVILDEATGVKFA